MKSLPVKLIVVLMLVFSLGSHWAILQSAAWISMILRYSQHDTLRDAMIKTFDGQHPCQMCILIKEGKKNEQQQKRPLIRLDQPDFLNEPVQPMGIPKFEAPDHCPRDFFGHERRERPPNPPPRIA
jgi:hypothetical protein